MFEDKEPFWLKYFYVRASSDFEDNGVDVVCSYCRHWCNFDSGEWTLEDLKDWAYGHLEECGK